MSIVLHEDPGRFTSNCIVAFASSSIFDCDGIPKSWAQVPVEIHVFDISGTCFQCVQKES